MTCVSKYNRTANRQLKLLEKIDSIQNQGWHGESRRHSEVQRKRRTSRFAGKMKPSTEWTDDGTRFNVNDRIWIKCHSTSSRSGFNHIADLYVDGSLVDSAKVHYINRTWESYQYQTVLSKLIEKTSEITFDEKEKIKKLISNNWRQEDLDRVNEQFGTIAKIAALGEVFGSTEKEKNDWKARMLKAGLGSSGLEMPEDWDTLSEDEKKKRLDKVITELKK